MSLRQAKILIRPDCGHPFCHGLSYCAEYGDPEPNSSTNPDKERRCRVCSYGVMVQRGEGLWATCDWCGTSRFVQVDDASAA